MQKMQISSSNSEHNSESDYSQKGDDSDFEKAFNKVFRYEMNNEQKYDEPEEVPYFLKTTKIYEEDLKSKDKLNSEKELIYDHNLNKEIIENKEEKIEKMILEVPEKGAVQIKTVGQQNLLQKRVEQNSNQKYLQLIKLKNILLLFLLNLRNIMKNIKMILFSKL